MQRLKIVLALFVALILVVGLGVRAQEHPKKQEHPAAKPASMADVEKAIKGDIEETAKANQGRFPVKDNVLNKTWALSLVRVHTDKLTQLDDTTYFACVDFKADEGTAVDVDFYLEGEQGKLKVTDTTVHKVNGVARFMYQQKGNFWERVGTGEQPKKQEQPKKEEHPKKEHPK